MTSPAGEPVGESLTVRPYARLLTMLGEQLIKNDRIALVELIKNSYDADASHVKVDLLGFTESLASGPGSSIAIIDDGFGMSADTVRDHWLNPATPAKDDYKKKHRTSPAGRLIQGEKGIGRFAMFKLGNRVKLITRGVGEAEELEIDFDLAFLDEPPVADFDDPTDPDSSGSDDGKEETENAPVFIEDIRVVLMRRDPEIFDGRNPRGLASNHGTRLEISGLRTKWTEAGIESAYDAVARLQPLVPRALDDPLASAVDSSSPTEPDFKIVFSQDGADLQFRETDDRELRRLFEERAAFRISGHFSDSENAFLMNINGHTSVVGLDEPEISGASDLSGVR